VVVATHDRPARLERLLDALERQVLAPERFEVIVVDDGSGPATRALLERRKSSGGLELLVLHQPVARGPGSARNIGWMRARSSLIAFTDDDCTPHPRWLTAALATHQAQPDALVQGRTEPDPTELDNDGLLSRTLRVDRLGPMYETCNIFYPRDALESLSGFDERFGLTPGGEDTDLAWRAIDSGRPAVFAPDAIVFHAVERLGVLGTLRVASRWTRTMRVFAEHPQTRKTLKNGVFWNVYHYLLLRSLLVLPFPAWLRRMVFGWHLSELHRRARAAGAGPWGVPFLLVHDAVEVFAVVRGAVRYRTLVL
jgi:GT2 family glycosyltransferase